jgi:miniconductance mechanosensitive channel
MKRFFLIDLTSIKKCDDTLLKKIEKFQFPEIVSGKKLTEHTNLGLLRYYLMNLLRDHAYINQQMTMIVRQLQPTENGLPVEVLGYSPLSDLALYEEFQSGLFEHIYTVLPDFDLKLYQKTNALL